MKVQIWKIPYSFLVGTNNLAFELQERGYIEADIFDEDEFWHLCNWSCWTNEKPKNLHSDLEVANSDVIFRDPDFEQYYLAISNGWRIFESLEDVIMYCLDYQSTQRRLRALVK